MMDYSYDPALGRIRKTDISSSETAKLAHDKGVFATSAALSAAYATGTAGDYALVTETDTFWTWDAETSAWVNTDSNTINPTWDSITEKPTFATVATSGSYNDLTDKPISGSGAYSELTGKPIDLTSYDNSYDGHITKFSYQSGGIDSFTMACLHFDDSVEDAAAKWSTPTVTGTAAYAVGKFGNGFAFDAANSHGPVRYPYNASYMDFNDNQKMTVEFWIKTTDSSLSSDGKFVFAHAGNQYEPNHNTRFQIDFDSGALKFGTARDDVNGGTLSQFTFGTVNDGTLHHCAVTYDGAGTVRTWLDGTLVTTGSFNCMSEGTYENTDPFPFGANHYGTAGVGAVFTLDEFRFTVGVERYTENFTPPVAAFSSDLIKTLYVDPNALSDATTSASGLMSASDKTKLDSLYTSVTINAQTASYTLVLSDKSKLITMNNASENTLTIPLNSSVAFPAGTWIDISNIGAGACTVTAASGVTLNGADGGTKELVQWAGTRLYKIAENAWITR